MFFVLLMKTLTTFFSVFLSNPTACYHTIAYSFVLWISSNCFSTRSQLLSNAENGGTDSESLSIF